MTNQLMRKKRHRRVRMKIKGSAKIPRLNVYKSLNNIYAQLINDETGKVIASVNDLKTKGKGNKTESAKNVGTEIAKKALAAGAETCVFDRGGFMYHGRIKAVAEGAREGGLKF